MSFILERSGRRNCIKTTFDFLNIPKFGRDVITVTKNIKFKCLNRISEEKNNVKEIIMFKIINA